MEESYTNLPDLYLRKYIMTEKVHNCRSNYLTRANQTIRGSTPIKRNLTTWDIVLEEVKWRAIDFR
jgi:hypothetical protein